MTQISISIGWIYLEKKLCVVNINIYVQLRLLGLSVSLFGGLACRVVNISGRYSGTSIDRCYIDFFKIGEELNFETFENFLKSEQAKARTEGQTLIFLRARGLKSLLITYYHSSQI